MLSNKFRYAGRVLSFFAVFAIVHASVFAQCVAPPSGMVHWWTADNNTFDIIGGNHGTLEGGATFGPGRVAQAFSLDGDNDYVEVAHDPDAAFNFDGSFTIDAWVFLESAPAPGDFAPIVSKWNDLGVNERGYFLAVDSGAIINAAVPVLRFDVSEDGLFVNGHTSIRVANVVFPLGTWTHVAGVFNGTTKAVDVYINGVLRNGSALIDGTITAPNPTTEPVLIGAGDLGSDERDFFDGSIDEVELFDRALTGTEVDSIFDAGANGKTIPILIDVKPGNGDEVDPINLKSKGKTPVAVLSTETFDATTMDIGSIRFAGASVSVKNNGTFHASFEDVNGDGRLDLVLHFNTQDLSALTDSSTEATLTGTTDTPRCVSATDSIKIVP